MHFLKANFDRYELFHIIIILLIGVTFLEGKHISFSSSQSELKTETINYGA